jgi:hypothetical protein
MPDAAEGEKVVHTGPGEVRRPDAEGLARLRALKGRAVDTSEAGDAP